MGYEKRASLPQRLRCFPPYLSPILNPSTSSAELRKSQEAIIAKMERAVDKRETIQIKYQKKGSGSGISSQQSVKSNSQPADTTAAIHKQISNLKTTLNQTTQNSKQLDNAIKERMAELETVSHPT